MHYKSKLFVVRNVPTSPCHLSFFDMLWLFMALLGTCWYFLWHFMALCGIFWYFWPVTLFCGEFTFVTIYALFWVKLYWNKPCLCNLFFCLFQCLLHCTALYFYILQVRTIFALCYMFKYWLLWVCQSGKWWGICSNFLWPASWMQ